MRPMSWWNKAHIRLNSSGTRMRSLSPHGLGCHELARLFKQPPPLPNGLPPSSRLDLAPIPALARAIARGLPLAYDPLAPVSIGDLADVATAAKTRHKVQAGHLQPGQQPFEPSPALEQRQGAQIPTVPVQEIEGEHRELVPSSPHPAKMQPNEVRNA